MRCVDDTEDVLEVMSDSSQSDEWRANSIVARPPGTPTDDLASNTYLNQIPPPLHAGFWNVIELVFHIIHKRNDQYPSVYVSTTVYTQTTEKDKYVMIGAFRQQQ